MRKVIDLKLLEFNDWNMDLLENLCDPETCAAIKKVKWPQMARNDKILWTRNNSSNFLLKVVT